MSQHKLKINNLSKFISNDNIRQYFSSSGKIESIIRINNSSAIITFNNIKALGNAIILNETFISYHNGCRKRKNYLSI